MRVTCSAASALSAPGRFSTMPGWPSCSESAWPMMRVVGSVEPPGGKPTMKRIGFAGYWASALLDTAKNSSATESSLRTRHSMAWLFDRHVGFLDHLAPQRKIVAVELG